MSSELNIIDLDDELVIRVARKPSLIEGILSFAATGTFGAIVAFLIRGGPVVIGVVVGAAVLAFLFTMRKKNLELRINPLEFALRGRVGDNLGSTRNVRCADIRWLEYQDDTTGPETSYHPGGLYAALAHRSICVLPDVDEEQTAMVIERIKEKFPDLRRRWANESPFGQHFTSLRLDES